MSDQPDYDSIWKDILEYFFFDFVGFFFPEVHTGTDMLLNRTDELLRKTIIKVDKIGDNLDDLGIVQGEVAEDLFYRNVIEWLPM